MVLFLAKHCFNYAVFSISFPYFKNILSKLHDFVVTLIPKTQSSVIFDFHWILCHPLTEGWGGAWYLVVMQVLVQSPLRHSSFLLFRTWLLHHSEKQETKGWTFFPILPLLKFCWWSMITWLILRGCWPPQITGMGNMQVLQRLCGLSTGQSLDKTWLDFFLSHFSSASRSPQLFVNLPHGG